MAETEAVLLRRFVRSGDAEAFAEIIQRYAGLVYSAALRVLADVDRASDIAQDTFLQLAKDAGTVTGSLPGWLHRVATHKAIDQIRRDATRKHREAEYMATRPEETAEWKDISPHVDEGLNLLDPHLRSILISHFLEGRSTREIARAHGLSQATISRRIEAGVELLRAGLRRRGILVAAGALGVLMAQNATQAAPPVLLTELGKIALISGSLAASTTAAGASSGFGALASSALAAAKAHATTLAVAAVVVVGTGSVALHHHVKNPMRQAETSSVDAATHGQMRVASPVGSDLAAAPDTPAGARPGWSPDAGAVAAAPGAGNYPQPPQALPGPEAETDPRDYVPGRSGDSVSTTVVPSSPGQDAASDQPRQAARAGVDAILQESMPGGLVEGADASKELPYEAVMRLRREALELAAASALSGIDFPVSAGAVVAKAKLEIVPPFVGNPGGMIGLQREDTTTVKPDSVLETPADAPREPVYFVFRAGDRKIQGITYRSTHPAGQIKLLLDTDGDGLWSDEQEYVGRRLWMFTLTATYEFGPVFLKQGATEPGGDAMYVQCTSGRWLTFWPAFYRAGEVTLDGKTYKVALVDSDFDGRFDEFVAPPGPDGRSPACDVFGMDLNGDSMFRYGGAGASEIAPLSRLIRVGGRYYGIEVAEDGSTVEFRQAEPVLPKPDPNGPGDGSALRLDVAQRGP